ncbi:MAG: small, acid-soluble spore protein, H family [Syntrophomonadaceae bacterium]|nr:small, acid-soluble spore protein, H family [Syntrophomonadaceae bacterium]
MQTERAREIVDSLGVIEVLHQGSPIWIEQLDGEFAEIRYLETGRRTRVPVHELVENSPLIG